MRSTVAIHPYDELALLDLLVLPLYVLTFCCPFGLKKYIVTLILEPQPINECMTDEQSNWLDGDSVVKHLWPLIWIQSFLNLLRAEERCLDSVSKLELDSAHGPISFRVHYFLQFHALLLLWKCYDVVLCWPAEIRPLFFAELGEFSNDRQRGTDVEDRLEVLALHCLHAFKFLGWVELRSWFAPLEQIAARGFLSLLILNFTDPVLKIGIEVDPQLGDICLKAAFISFFGYLQQSIRVLFRCKIQVYDLIVLLDQFWNLLGEYEQSEP